jgi:hypothetical protein
MLMWIVREGFMVINANVDRQRMVHGDISRTELY